MIHTVDRPKIAAALAEEMARQGGAAVFVQINTGPSRKGRCAPRSGRRFIEACRCEYVFTLKA